MDIPEIVARVRAIARHHGWGLGVHGSMVRDLDLIAVPWVDGAVTIDALVSAIMADTGYISHGYSARPRPGGRRSILLMHPDATFVQTEKGTWMPPCLDISFADPRERAEE